MRPIIAIVDVLGAGGAAYCRFKFVRGRKQKDQGLDSFDDEGYEEEPYVNEDEKAQIAEDEGDQEDEE